MAQLKTKKTYFDNDDLNRPLSRTKDSKGKVYTNADLDVKNDFEPDEELIDFDISPNNEELIDFDNESNPNIKAVDEILLKNNS